MLVSLLTYAAILATTTVLASPAVISALPMPKPINTLAARASTACNANNCLRAVRGTAVAGRDGASDCSAFFKTTVTPSTSTVYVTATSTTASAQTSSVTVSTTTSVTSTRTSTSVTGTTTTTFTSSTSFINPQSTVLQGKKRQVTVTPSVIPAYASPCANAAAYSSACSCMGVTATTVTASTPVITVTRGTTLSLSSTVSTTVATNTLTLTVQTTTTTTTSFTSTATGSIETDVPLFYLRILSNNVYNGDYITLANDGSQAYQNLHVGSNTAATQPFYLNTADSSFRTVNGLKFMAAVDPPANNPGSFVYIFDSYPDYAALVCQISSDNGLVSCLDSGVAAIFTVSTSTNGTPNIVVVKDPSQVGTYSYTGAVQLQAVYTTS